MKKKIDAQTARKLCHGCIHQRDLSQKCLRCFVQVLGEWIPTQKEPEAKGGGARDPEE